MADRLKRGPYAQEHPRRMAGKRAAAQVSLPPAKDAERWLLKMKMYMPSWLVGGTRHGRK